MEGLEFNLDPNLSSSSTSRSSHDNQIFISSNPSHQGYDIDQPKSINPFVVRKLERMTLPHVSTIKYKNFVCNIASVTNNLFEPTVFSHANNT